MIASGSYDPDSQTLTVVFTRGQEYSYQGVPPDKWQGLKSAHSVGRYFNEAIKGRYGND
jgi:nitrogen regulatory protein PII-like uncharacterized protein